MRRAILAVALLLTLAGAAHAEPVTVAVLYFDNNSSLREYDVLQKGLADMLVTDLSQVPGLQVVERDKLQKLLDELKLQRSKFFDPATAQQLGRGIGARYAVTGALAAIDPKVRLDVRVIEVATAKVVVADRVVGDRQKVFDLESELVGKLAAALQVKLAGAAPRSGVGDVATLLQYSQGIDAADKGDLQGASRHLAEVVRTAPDFQLARDKYADVVRRLRQAGQRRQEVMSVAEAELVKSLDWHVVAPAKLSGEALGRALGYRIARGNYQLWKLAALVASHHSSFGPAVAPPEQRAEVQQRSLAYYENTQLLLKTLRASRDPGGHVFPDGQVDAEDRTRAESLGWKGIEKWSFVTPASVALGLARFTLHGEAPFWGPVSLSLRPALVDLDRAHGPRALALIEEAEKELKAAVERKEEKVDALIEAIDVHAEALVALGRKEEAIAQWQRVLDGYPTATKYKEYEKKIEDLLAMSPEATQFAGALKTCSNELWSLMPGAMARARRAAGRAGVRKQIEQVSAACGGGPSGLGFQASAWQFGVQEALKAGDCELYREIKATATKQSAALGGNVVEGITRTAGNACGERLAEMNR